MKSYKITGRFKDDVSVFLWLDCRNGNIPVNFQDKLVIKILLRLGILKTQEKITYALWR